MKNSELGFVGDERLYLSYSFPVKLGGRCGVSPLHPTRGIAPGPFFRKQQFVSHKQFPGGTEHHADTHSQRKIVFLRIGCGTAAPRAGRRNAANRMLCIRGKHEKRSEGKQAFPADFFQCFHSARVLSFRFSKQHAERSLEKQLSASQEGCRADGPAAGYRGCISPCPVISWKAKEKRGANPSL